MLKFVNIQLIRNYSRTTSLLLRQQVISDPQPPIIPQTVEIPSNKDEHTVEIKKLKKSDKELAQLITLIKAKKKKEADNQIIVEGKLINVF
jgi:hypothetical protein